MIDKKKLIKDIKTYTILFYGTDITNKKEVIEFQDECQEIDALYSFQGILDAMDIINNQPKLNEWIPIEKELPKTKGEYLVSYHPCCWDNVSEEIIVGIDSFRGKSSWAKKKYQKVIAWMPLPKPYGGDEND